MSAEPRYPIEPLAAALGIELGRTGQDLLAQAFLDPQEAT